MITGSISVDREAVLPVAVYGMAVLQNFEAVIDTGFNGYLTLSGAEIATLGLSFHSQTLVMLGDGSMIELREFEAVLDWNGQTRDVLLYGFDVWLRVLDGGHVKIEAV